MHNARTKNRRLLPASLLAVAVLAGCETAPVTGRNQLILLSEPEAAQMGAAAYQQILSESKVVADPELNRRVNEIGRRIVAVSGQPDLDWQFTVIQDPQPNAFALPGGKVGVHTGMFDVAKNDDQLAAVMAHEIAHVIARHSAERVSQQVVVQGGLAAAGLAASSQGLDGGLVQLAAAAATLGIVLPFSRNQEGEADQIGLNYMARAGYDPREAVALWRNFQSAGNGRPPEFLSTHPGPESRIERLEAMLPEAMEIYRANR